MAISGFNIRVYGVLQNDQKDILVSDELIRGNYFTKFPGGGMELGEGTRDCLEREFMEELHLKVSVEEHLYTTDFFQPSAFNSQHQIIAIYYKVKAVEPMVFPVHTKPFDFTPEQLQEYETIRQIEAHRWITWENFSSDSVDLPIDKIVAGLLKNNY